MPMNNQHFRTFINQNLNLARNHIYKYNSLRSNDTMERMDTSTIGSRCAIVPPPQIRSRAEANFQQ